MSDALLSALMEEVPGADAGLMAVLQSNADGVGEALQAARTQCAGSGTGSVGLDALLGTLMQGRTRDDAAAEAAALVVALRWVHTPPAAPLACVAADGDTARAAPTVQEALVTESSGSKVGSNIAAVAAAYTHLRTWLVSAWGPPVEDLDEADPVSTRVELVRSLATAQGCLQGASSLPSGVVTCGLVRAAVTGTRGQVEHQLRLALSALAGRAHGPGPGRPVESLYATTSSLHIGVDRWTQALDHAAGVMAPGLHRADDTHLPAQLGVVALIIYAEACLRNRVPDQVRRDRIVQVLTSGDQARRLLESGLAALQRADPGYGGNEVRTWLASVVEQYLDHEALGLAHLGEWMRLLCAWSPDPQRSSMLEVWEEHPPPRRGRPRPTHPPAWIEAWDAATELLQQRSLVRFQEQDWSSVGCRAITALMLYALSHRHPDLTDWGERIACAAWLASDPARFYRVVPPVVAEAGHDLDHVDPTDPVSLEWAWVHREWDPDAPSGVRWDGMTRGIARGLPFCAIRVLLRPWVAGALGEELEQLRGARARGQRVEVTGGDHAGEAAKIELAVWEEDDDRETIAAGVPPAYLLTLDRTEPAQAPRRVVVEAAHLTGAADSAPPPDRG